MGASTWAFGRDMKTLHILALLMIAVLAAAAVQVDRLLIRGQGLLIHSSVTDFEVALRCDSGHYMLSLHHDCGRPVGALEILPYSFRVLDKSDQFIDARITNTDFGQGVYPYIRFSAWIPVIVAFATWLTLAGTVIQKSRTRRDTATATSRLVGNVTRIMNPNSRLDARPR
jgi:hypothetical protein